VNAIFVSRFGRHVIEWDRAAYDHVMEQLQGERQQSEDSKAFDDSMDQLCTALTNASLLVAESPDTVTLTQRASRLIGVLADIAVIVTCESIKKAQQSSQKLTSDKLETEIDISHADDTA
jgi:hypothetical protein